jgi:hypothetical protein
MPMPEPQPASEEPALPSFLGAPSMAEFGFAKGSGDL